MSQTYSKIHWWKQITIVAQEIEIIYGKQNIPISVKLYLLLYHAINTKRCAYAGLLFHK